MDGTGEVGGPIGGLIWLPMLGFEVTLALWLLTKGIATPRLDEFARQT